MWTWTLCICRTARLSRWYWFSRTIWFAGIPRIYRSSWFSRWSGTSRQHRTTRRSRWSRTTWAIGTPRIYRWTSMLCSSEL